MTEECEVRAKSVLEVAINLLNYLCSLAVALSRASLKMRRASLGAALEGFLPPWQGANCFEDVDRCRRHVAGGQRGC